MATDRIRGSVAIASTGNTAGSTTNSSTLTQGDTYQSFAFYGKITNGGTGPTIPMTVKLQVYDGTNWNDTGIQVTGGIANSLVTPFMFEVPIPFFDVRIQATGNTAQTVTIECSYDTLTSLA